MGVDLDERAISRSHGIGQKLPPASDGGDRPPAIIVRFVSHRDLRLMYAAYKKLKGTNIVVREDLTTRRRSCYIDCAAAGPAMVGQRLEGCGDKTDGCQGLAGRLR